jgi:hypothetical protein
MNIRTFEISINSTVYSTQGWEGVQLKSCNFIIGDGLPTKGYFTRTNGIIVGKATAPKLRRKVGIS